MFNFLKTKSKKPEICRFNGVALLGYPIGNKKVYLGGKTIELSNVYSEYLYKNLLFRFFQDVEFINIIKIHIAKLKAREISDSLRDLIDRVSPSSIIKEFEDNDLIITASAVDQKTDMARTSGVYKILDKVYIVPVTSIIDEKKEEKRIQNELEESPAFVEKLYRTVLSLYSQNDKISISDIKKALPDFSNRMIYEGVFQLNWMRIVFFERK